MFILYRIKEPNLEYLVVVCRCDHVDVFYYVTHHYYILSHHWLQPFLWYLIDEFIFVHAMEYFVIIINSYFLNLPSFFVGFLDVIKRVRYNIKVVRLSQIMIIFKVVWPGVLFKSPDKLIKWTINHLLNTPRYNYKRNMVLFHRSQ